MYTDRPEPPVPSLFFGVGGPKVAMRYQAGAYYKARIPRTTNISSSSIMEGCLSAFRILISLRAVTGIPSRSLCISIRLSATARLLRS
jgi:hypothetical protein